jgi:hypothetical protein
MPTAPYPVLDVSGWDVVADETSGAEEKYWLQEPGRDLRWLFKATTIRGDHVYGEDWAEKCVSELGGLLGVPCATIELATRNEKRGCISADLRPSQFELHHGRVLLEECGAPGYVHQMGRSHPGHSLKNICSSLRDALPPPGCELPFDASAYDVFAGYTVLDAWVANRDRHDTNWAVLRPAFASDGPLRLCGSYDHASSLGFNLTDEHCSRRIADDTVKAWCEKGTAQRFDYDHSRPMPTLVELASHALDLASPAARDHWLQRFRQVEEIDVRNVLGRVSVMSDPARTFAEIVLDVNRKRVLDVCA